MFLFALLAVTLLVNCAAISATETTFGVEVFDMDGILGSQGLFEGTSLVNSSLDPMSPALMDHFLAALEDQPRLDSAYEKYTAQYQKKMSPDSKKVFKSSLITVFQHNIRAFLGQETFIMGVNEFSDMTLGELNTQYTGLWAKKDNGNVSSLKAIPAELIDDVDVPDSMDWRKLGVVTPPKNQGPCGSCVLFATTAAVESAMAIENDVGGLDLSEQQLLDCAEGLGIFRCEGNYHFSLYDYLTKEWQTSEIEYPYEAKEGECRIRGKNKIAKLIQYYTTNEVNQMKTFIGKFGPSSVTLTVNEGFQYYKSGIMNSPCDVHRPPNHSVLVVGYGSERKGNDYIDYWLVKNSWGTSWGDDGYIKILRNANMCKIEEEMIKPFVQ